MSTKVNIPKDGRLFDWKDVEAVAQEEAILFGEYLARNPQIIIKGEVTIEEAYDKFAQRQERPLNKGAK